MRVRDQLRTRLQFKALENVVHVRSNGGFSEMQRLADFGIGAAFGQQCYDLLLTARQRLDGRWCDDRG